MKASNQEQASAILNVLIPGLATRYFPLQPQVRAVDVFGVRTVLEPVFEFYKEKDDS